MFAAEIGVHAATQTDEEAERLGRYLLENFLGTFSWSVVSRGENSVHLKIWIKGSSINDARYRLEDQLRLPGLTYHWFLLKPVKEETS